MAWIEPSPRGYRVRYRHGAEIRSESGFPAARDARHRAEQITAVHGDPLTPREHPQRPPVSTQHHPQPDAPPTPPTGEVNAYHPFLAPAR
jgi:hypothetical protein